MINMNVFFSSTLAAAFSLVAFGSAAQTGYSQSSSKLGAFAQSSMVVPVSDNRASFVNLIDKVPNQEMLLGLIASGTFSALMFNMSREIAVEIKDGYWVEAIPLDNGIPDGSRFTITRTSSWGSKVILAGQSDPIELALGMTYVFEVQNGRWQVLDVRMAGSKQKAPVAPTTQAQTQPTSQGMNVPQSEIYQRKKWFAVKLDNSWYAATASKRYAKQNFYVRFDPAMSCKGYVGYDYPGNGNPPQAGPFQKGIRLNTGRKTWTVDAGVASVRYDAPSDSVLIEFPANMEFITALAKQNSVKLGFGPNNDYYDDMSLSGSWASIVWALDRCKADYSLSSSPSIGNAPSASPPSGTPNPPIGFCMSCEPPATTTRRELEQVARFDGQGADGYMSNFTVINNFGDWPYQCNGEQCFLDVEESNNIPGPKPNLTKPYTPPSGYCWARGYSADHLNAHPKQVVATLWLEFKGDPMSGRSVNANMAVISSNNAMLRRRGNANQLFTQGLVCFVNSDGQMVCSADMDGGYLELRPRDAETMDVRTSYLSVWGHRENSFDLAELPGQTTTYRLVRYPAEVCRERK